MSHDALFEGAVSALLGAMVGSLLTLWLSREFQTKLLDRLRLAQKNVEEQAELAALTGYANLTLVLWQHNEKEAEHDLARKQFWVDSAKTRYDEMMKAREIIESRLKEKGLLPES
jgi:hypothetical protein